MSRQPTSGPVLASLDDRLFFTRSPAAAAAATAAVIVCLQPCCVCVFHCVLCFVVQLVSTACLGNVLQPILSTLSVARNSSHLLWCIVVRVSTACGNTRKLSELEILSGNTRIL